MESASFGGGRFLVSEGLAGKVYTPHYYITDHLGSTRAIVSADGELREVSNYYPFGTRHTNPDTAVSDNRYRFSGKADQEQLGPDFQDFGARMYDGALGRWWSMDPLAEKYYSISPYAYCANNPIRFIDPNGMEISGPDGGFIFDPFRLFTDWDYCKDFGNVVLDLLAWTDLDDITVLGSTLFSELPFSNIEPVHINGESASAEDIQVAKSGLLLPIVSGRATNKIGSAIDKATGITTETSRSARRQVMREEGIPTSQQPRSQSKNEAGREYIYEVPKEGGGTQIKSVQQQTLDRSHPNEPHWEAGSVKTDRWGFPLQNFYDRYKLYKVQD